MIEEPFVGNKDPMSLPHPHSTIHIPSVREHLTRVEQLLGDNVALQGEQVASWLAFICNLVQDLDTKAHMFSTAMESCQA